uniref:CapA family protein n=1 Tax=Dictyoglomus thermophilum TaxID=14 RepID=A0A7C3MQC2_DICTH
MWLEIIYKRLIKILLFLFVIVYFTLSNTYEEEFKNLSLAFAGDLFLQKHLSNSYYDPSSKKYYFPPDIFEEIEEYIRKDFSSIVIDTPIASNIFQVSGYPLFNAPVEILDLLKKSGFNIMILSTNHIFDKGEIGLTATIENIKKRGLYYVGAYTSEEDSKNFLVLSKNGIKVGILAYTFSINGFSLPKNKEYMVNLINEDKIKEDIRKIKNLVDFTIIYLHWGYIEYSEKLESYQKSLAKKIISWGGDLIVGSHPHSVRPYEKINGKWCFYSLGNFFTDQYGLNIPQVKFGLILNITLNKYKNKTFIIRKEIIPIFISKTTKDKNNPHRYKVIKAEKITNLTYVESDSKIYLKKVLNYISKGE